MIDENQLIDEIKECFNTIFKYLPLSGLIGERILCVHGGIGTLENISQIANIQRPCNVICDQPTPQHTDDERAVVDILWSDPAEDDEDLGFAGFIFFFFIFFVAAQRV